MVYVKDIMDENMKAFMREIATSVRNDIKETSKDVMITKKEERKIDSITQGTPQQTPRDDQLNNLIEEMEIEKKTLTRVKHQHHLKKLKTKKTMKQYRITVNSHPKRELTLGSQDKKDLTEKEKIGKMSLYKEQNPRETKKNQIKEQKGQNIKAIKLNKTIPSTHKQTNNINVESPYL